MSDDFRRQIRDNFEQKDTDELLALWQANNRAEWSALSFEVIEAILRERLGEIPAQGEPCYEHAKIDEKEPEVDQPAEDDPASPLYPFLCAENAPVLYRAQDVLRMERWLNGLAIVVPALTVLQGLVTYWPAFSFRNVSFSAWLEKYCVNDLLVIGLVIASAAISFITLKALAVILKMLMQMEFRSRGIGKKPEQIIP